jgi:SAM-dependent methyltransferase
VPDAWINQRPGLVGSAKLAILERGYGYHGLSNRAGSRLGALLGSVAGAVGLGSERAGRTVRFLHAKPGGRLLDVGCGNGSFLSVMKDLGWECDGVEPDPVAAGVALNLGHHVRQGSIEDLKMPEGHYDAVTLSHVMEHFPNPHTAMAAIAKLLKPGGIFFSVSPNPAGLIRRVYGDKWYGLMAPQHLVIPTTHGYRHLCMQVGLRPKCWTSTANCYWYLRESISIRRTGATGNYTGSLWPKLVALATTMARPLFPDIGEEAVCYAVKE